MLRIWEDRRWLLFCGAAALLGAAAVGSHAPVLSRLAQPLDDAWMRVLLMRNPYLFLDHWPLEAWGRLACPSSVTARARRSAGLPARGRLRTLIVGRDLGVAAVSCWRRRALVGRRRVQPSRRTGAALASALAPRASWLPRRPAAGSRSDSGAGARSAAARLAAATPALAWMSIRPARIGRGPARCSRCYSRWRRSPPVDGRKLHRHVLLTATGAVTLAAISLRATSGAAVGCRRWRLALEPPTSARRRPTVSPQSCTTPRAC